MLRMFLRRLFFFGDKGRLLACREVIPRVSDFLDQELGAEVMQKIREHLEVCPSCRRFMESLEKTSRVLSLDPASPIPEDAASKMVDDLREEYRCVRRELEDLNSD